MKKVLEKRKDIAFYIKLFPLKMHKDAYWKSKSIVCSNSMKMLEDNFEKKSIPKNDCDTKEIDDNIKLAESLGITGTPTIIMPDGKIYSGSMPADRLVEIINRRK
jgi:thiol:disulfide interchange protein DsbC